MGHSFLNKKLITTNQTQKNLKNSLNPNMKNQISNDNVRNKSTGETISFLNGSNQTDKNKSNNEFENSFNSGIKKPCELSTNGENCSIYHSLNECYNCKKLVELLEKKDELIEYLSIPVNDKKEKHKKKFISLRTKGKREMNNLLFIF